MQAPPLSPPNTASARYVPSGCDHVAVYGTLRADGANDIRRLGNGVRIVGLTCLSGTLHDLGWYPGLRLDGARNVVAEVYALNPGLEQALDRIEGLWPNDVGEYRKRQLSQRVSLIEGAVEVLDVLVYEATPRVLAGKPVIDAPDWLTWYQGTGRGEPVHFHLGSVAGARPARA